MASISSAGVGSGLDVAGLIKQIMTVESQPLTVLDTKEATFQAKLSAYGSLKGGVSALQTAARALKSTTLYNSMSATSGSSSVFAASANTAAQAGTYSVEVVARAQAQAISSQGFASLTGDIATANGSKLKIELGTYSGGVGGTFTANPDKTVTLEFDTTNSSLEEVRDAINANSAIGVKANIVYVGDAGYKLTLTAKELGAGNSVRLTTYDSNDVVQNDNTGLSKLSFDPAVDRTALPNGGNQFDVNTVAQDAHIKVDGLSVYRTTNSISDAITGVTLSLAGTGTTTLTVTKDSSSAKTALDTFVKAYNDVAKQLRDATAYNSETKKASLLTGDSGARSLQSALRGMISNSRSSAGSAVSTLSDLGISLQRDGSLVFNSSKFDAANAVSSTNVADLLNSTSSSSPGLAVRMTSTLDSILSSTGLLASRTEGIGISIKDIGSRRETLTRRLAAIEQRYRNQFSTLDTLVASMKKTSEYLTQQLANLPSTQ